MQPVADLILPPLCFGCGNRIAAAADLICQNCSDQIITPGEDICQVCGTQLEQGTCQRCSETQPCFKVARSALMYQSPVKEIIHLLKYDSWSILSPLLSRCMLETFHSEPRFANCDIVTAVPLHRVRQRERGFNQSALIARHLARHLGLEFAILAKRTRYTLSQTRLSKTQREHNLDGAFAVKAKTRLTGRHILLVDDVFTTGTTVDTLSRLFLDNGAASVAVLTAARAI